MKTDTTPTIRGLARHGLLLAWLERLIQANAIKSIDFPKEYVEKRKQQFFRDNGINSKEDLDTFLANNCLSAEDLEWQLSVDERVRKAAHSMFGGKAEQRFLQRKNSLDRVVYSLLRVRDEGLATELYLRLLDQEQSFSDISRSFSEGPEKTTNGLVGPVPLTQAHPILAEKLRCSGVGTLVEPFRIDDWWIVVRLENYLPATFDTTMADAMNLELFEEWVSMQAKSIIKESITPTSSI